MFCWTAFQMQKRSLSTLRRIFLLHYLNDNKKIKHEQVKRFAVPNDKVSWTETYPWYKPVIYTDPKVLSATWADPDIAYV